MKSKKIKIYLDKGMHPCVIVCNNYENTGNLLIKQLRYNLSNSGFIADYDSLVYLGEFSNKEYKKLKQICVNKKS